MTSAPSPPQSLDGFQQELAATHRVAEQWTTERTRARCIRLEPTDPSGATIFVKEFTQDEPAVAERVFDLLTMLNEVVETRPAAARRYVAPRPIAFGLAPPFVAYHWVPGTNLSTELRRLAACAPSPDDSEDDAADLAGAAGRALAQLHHDLARTHSDVETLPVRRPRWMGWLSRLGAFRRDPKPAIADIGPWNIVVSSSSSPAFIDIDVERRREVEFDLGWLAYFLIDKSGPGLPRSRAARLPAALLDGYVDSSDGVALGPSRSLAAWCAVSTGLSRNLKRLVSGRTSAADRRAALRRLGLTLTLVPLAFGRGAHGVSRP